MKAAGQETGGAVGAAPSGHPRYNRFSGGSWRRRELRLRPGATISSFWGSHAALIR